jgi:hypothetical protein
MTLGPAYDNDPGLRRRRQRAVGVLGSPAVPLPTASASLVVVPAAPAACRLAPGVLDPARTRRSARSPPRPAQETRLRPSAPARFASSRRHNQAAFHQRPSQRDLRRRTGWCAFPATSSRLPPCGTAALGCRPIARAPTKRTHFASHTRFAKRTQSRPTPVLQSEPNLAPHPFCKTNPISPRLTPGTPLSRPTRSTTLAKSAILEPASRRIDPP